MRFKYWREIMPRDKTHKMIFRDIAHRAKCAIFVRNSLVGRTFRLSIVRKATGKHQIKEYNIGPPVPILMAPT